MKKFLAAVLVLCLSLTLVACGASNVVSGYKSGDVTLGQYEGLTYTPGSTEVTDAEVDEEIESDLLSANQVQSLVEDRTTVEDGDIVNIDYAGTQNGVAFEGGTDTGYDLTIGSGSFIDGFEDEIIGHEVGETFSFDITFPDDYSNEDLAGADATFTVTVNSISEMVDPELTDELVAANTDYSTVEEYRASILEELTDEKEEDAEAYKEYQIYSQLLENCTVNADIAEQISESKTNMISSYDSMYQSYYSVDAATFYSYIYGMTEDQFDEYMEARAKISIQYSYIMSAIAEAEGITATDEEIEELKKEMMDSYGYDDEEELLSELKEYYGANGSKVIEDQVKINKASDLVLDSAIAE